MFLDAMSPELRRRLFAGAQRRHFPPGTTIFAAGSPGTSMLLLETGRVEVCLYNSDGRKLVLNHVGPGDVLGEFALLDGGTRSAEVVAAAQTTGLEFARSEVMSTLLAEPEAMMALLAEVCRKARETIISVESFSHRQAATRLAQCLIRLGDKWGEETGGAVVITQDFSQADLGEIAGLARENVNRLLKRWTADRIVELGNGTLMILDRNALAVIAGA